MARTLRSDAFIVRNALSDPAGLLWATVVSAASDPTRKFEKPFRLGICFPEEGQQRRLVCIAQSKIGMPCGLNGALHAPVTTDHVHNDRFGGSMPARKILDLCHGK